MIGSRIPKLNITEGIVNAANLSDTVCPEQQVWRDPDGRIYAYWYTMNHQHWMHLPGLASFCFNNSGETVKAIAHPPVKPDLIRDAYRQTVLPIVLQALDTEVLHASALFMSRGVVALCGDSGTGKSTTAYGLSRRGYPLWADDAVAFETVNRCIRAIPLPFKIRLQPDSKSFFGQEQVAAYPSSSWDSVNQAKRKPVPLVAIFALKQVLCEGRGLQVETFPLSPTQAFPAMLCHAYCFSLQDVERKRRMMQRYLNLAAQVPVFEIHFQSGLEKLPAILNSMEQALDIALTESTAKRFSRKGKNAV